MVQNFLENVPENPKFQNSLIASHDTQNSGYWERKTKWKRNLSAKCYEILYT